MNDLDWDLLRTFLCVGESGSLTAAAQRLGRSQPTVSRQVQQLEEALAVPLFIRHARGLELTERGAALMAPAREILASVDGFFRRAGGMTREVSGSVRLSATEPVAVQILPDCLAALRQKYPGLTIELVVDNRPSDLLRREADIAVRLFQPKQLDLVCTLAGEAAVGLFASRAYLERRGRPARVADLEGHDAIGDDRARRVDTVLMELGLDLTQIQFSLRTDNYLAQLSAIRAGLGIGGAQVNIMREFEEVERVLPELTLARLPMWVVMHAEVRKSAPIRAVYDAVVGHLRACLGPVNGAAI